MIITIDRIEEKIAVCEDENKNMISIELSKFPIGAIEGETFEIIDGIILRKVDTSCKSEEIKKLIDELWE